AVLWKRTMGTTVLAPPASAADLRVYAHCLPGKPGGVGLALINIDSAAREFALGSRGGQAWVLQAPALDSKAVTISGRAPSLAADGALSGLEGVVVSSRVEVPGQSIAFVAVPTADNAACR